MKRLKALGYQIIYISKEVATEVTQKNGNKYTTYKPNIGDKVANVLAGTVDLTIRAYMKGEDRFIQLAKDENVFGGGRFNFKTKTCKLDMNEFTESLIGAQELVGYVSDKVDEPRKARKTEEPKEELPEIKDEEVKEDKSRRSRRTKVEEVGTKEETKVEDSVSENKEPVQEEERPRRRRSRKAE